MSVPKSGNGKDGAAPSAAPVARVRSVINLDDEIASNVSSKSAALSKRDSSASQAGKKRTAKTERGMHKGLVLLIVDYLKRSGLDEAATTVAEANELWPETYRLPETLENLLQAPGSAPTAPLTLAQWAELATTFDSHAMGANADAARVPIQPGQVHPSLVNETGYDSFEKILGSSRGKLEDLMKQFIPTIVVTSKRKSKHEVTIGGTMFMTRPVAFEVVTDESELAEQCNVTIDENEVFNYTIDLLDMHFEVWLLDGFGAIEGSLQELVALMRKEYGPKVKEAHAKTVSLVLVNLFWKYN